MQTVQGNLTIVGAETGAPRVFWKGQKIEVKKLYISGGKVYITVSRDTVIPEDMSSQVRVRKVK